MEGRPLAEAELVRRAKHAEVTAYSELVRRHQNGRLPDRIPRHRLGRGRGGIRPGRIREGVCRSRPVRRREAVSPVATRDRRKRRSEPRALARPARAAPAPLGGRVRGEAAPSPPDPFALADARSDALRLVGRLRVEEQRVVLAKFVVGLTDEETASSLGLPVGTVKSRLSRALAHLRAELERVE